MTDPSGIGRLYQVGSGLVSNIVSRAYARFQYGQDSLPEVLYFTIIIMASPTWQSLVSLTTQSSVSLIQALKGPGY